MQTSEHLASDKVMTGSEDNGSRVESSNPMMQKHGKKWFGSIKISKATNFPLLYREEGGAQICMEASTWRNKITSWAGAQGMKGIFPLAKALVRLNEEGTKLIPAADALTEDYGNSRQGMMETLVIVAGTSFGISLDLPNADEIRRMTAAEL